MAKRRQKTSKKKTEVKLRMLVVESRFASYDLQPFTDDSTYVVHVLRHAPATS